MSIPKKPQATSGRDEARLYVVSRAWLTTLVVLALLPWAVLAGMLLRGGRVDLQAGPASGAPAIVRAGGGPWGSVSRTPILISPPIELIAEDWGREADAGKYWFFPETPAPAAQAFLASTGLTSGQVSGLMATAKPEPRINGVVMLPGADLVRALPPDVRSRLYTRLAASPLNVNIAHAFRFAGTSPDEWLGESSIAPSTRAIVEPLVYRHGEHLYLADIDLIFSLVTDAGERRRLARAIFRQRTVRARLEVSSHSEIPGLVDYWGRGGRRLDIRPLIESLAGAATEADRTIDVVHLLPALAREHLYRYPRRTALDFDRPALANCLWTALNFFEADPDDRLLDVGVAVARLKQDYYLVENSPEFGDIIVMVDERGNIFHAVNFLADDLVFTKNGVSPMAPWVILPMDEVLDYYRTRSEKPDLLIHRRKDF
jgi:hypothetical protein